MRTSDWSSDVCSSDLPRILRQYLVQRPYSIVKSSISLGRLVLRGTVGTLAVKILSAAASLGMNVVLARALSTADYGVVAVGFSWVTVIAVIACFGSETASVRFVAQARAAMDSARSEEHTSELQSLMRISYA